MTRSKSRNTQRKEFWVVNIKDEVIHRATTKHQAAAFVHGNGGRGYVVKVRGVRLPSPPVW